MDIEKYTETNKIITILRSKEDDITKIKRFHGFQAFVEKDHPFKFEKVLGNTYAFMSNYKFMPLVGYSGTVYTTMEAANVSHQDMTKHWLANKTPAGSIYLVFKNEYSIKTLNIFQMNRFPHEYPDTMIISVSDNNVNFSAIRTASLNKQPEDVIYFDEPINKPYIRLTFPNMERVCVTKVKVITVDAFNNYVTLLSNVEKSISKSVNDYYTGNVERYTNRYSNEQNKLLFNKFKNYINANNKFVSFRDVKTAVANNDHNKAFSAYRTHLTSKLTTPDTYGIDRSIISLDKNPKYYIRGRTDGASSANLMQGLYSGKNVEPGKAYGWAITTNGKYKVLSWSLGAIHNLVDSYLYTLDLKYLRKWIDYLDDWSLNFTKLDDWSNVDDLEQELINDVLTFYKFLGTLSNFFPEAYRLIPTTTIIRVLFKMMEVNIPAYIYYMRNNSQNWRADVAPVCIILAFLLDEFDISSSLLNEGFKAIEDYTTNVILPDGTCTQQCPWYNFMYYHMMDITNIMKTRRRAYYWLTDQEADILNNPLLEIKMQIVSDKVSLFLKNHVQYNYEYPAGGRIDKRDMMSSVYNDSGITSGISTFSTETLLKDTSQSSIFPNGGYAYIKDKDNYTFLFNSPRPGAGAGYRSMKNNNSVTISVGGRDMIVTNEMGAYEFIASPVVPSTGGQELNQAFHYYTNIDTDIIKSHKGYIVNAWSDVANILYRFGNEYSIMKSTYNGPYLGTAIALDYSHTRTVIYLPKIKSWVIRDVMKKDTSSTVTAIQKFWLPSVNSPVLSGNTVSFNNDYKMIQYGKSVGLEKYAVNSSNKPYDLFYLKTWFDNSVISVLAPKSVVVSNTGGLKLNDYVIDFANETIIRGDEQIFSSSDYIDLKESPRVTANKNRMIVGEDIVADREVLMGINNGDFKKRDRIRLTEPGILRIKNSEEDVSETIISIYRQTNIKPVSMASRSVVVIHQGDWRDLYMQLFNSNVYLPGKQYPVTKLFNKNDLNFKAPYLARYEVVLDATTTDIHYIDAPLDYCQMSRLIKYDMVVRINGIIWKPSYNFIYPGRWYFRLSPGQYLIEISFLNLNDKLPYAECTINDLIKK